MFSLSGSGDIEVEKEKPRLLPSMFPNFAQLFGNFPPRPFPIPNPGPSSLPTSSPSSNNNSGVFPLFPPNFGPYYALMQQNQLISQFNKNGNLLNSSTSESSIESRASSADSGNKKLQTDSDGKITCPVCEQKFSQDTNWEAHLEEERRSLISSIEKIREQKLSSVMNFENLSEKSQVASKSREKRENELQRIRMNQQKRLSWKSISPLTTRNSESSSICSPADKSLCRGCERQHEFLVISSFLDEARCLDCFQKYRKQTNFLPSSITESPVEEKSNPSTPSSLLNHTVDELLNMTSPSMKKRRLSPQEELVEEKRIKIEI